MNWVSESKIVFACEKPEHFTNFNHCEECAEHDQTLINSEIDSIGLTELGNAGWDPICFCSAAGKKYYMPALIRLSIETLDNLLYLPQLLFHLESDGENNELFCSCTVAQRFFIANFISSMITEHPDKIESNNCSNEALRVYEIWSKA